MQKNIKAEIKPYALVVRNFNTPLSPMDRSARQELNREIRELRDVITHMELINVYRTFHPNTKEYTFFSEPHKTFSKIDHESKPQQIQKHWNNALYFIVLPWLKVRIQQLVF